MNIGNELLQGIIAAVIVAVVIMFCCIFYWCKRHIQKTKLRSVNLQLTDLESQKDTTDGRPQKKRIKSKEDRWHRQEQRRKLRQIIHDHEQREGKLSQPQLGQLKELDLHNYTVKEAMEAFELYLAVSLDDYNEADLQENRFIEVITGRGKHSKDGIPVIKLSVSDYLVKYSYTHSWPNPGMVRIDLFSKTQGGLQASGQKPWRQFLGCNVV